MATNESQVRSKHSPEQLERYCTRYWLFLASLMTAGRQDLASTGVCVCVPSTGRSYRSLSTVLENEHLPESPMVSVSWTVFSFTWQYFPSPGFWVFSGFLCSWKSDLLRCSLWQWISLFRPRPQAAPSPADLRSGAEWDTDAFACSRAGGWLLPLVPPCTHASSQCSKRIVFLLISTQAPSWTTVIRLLLLQQLN